MCDSLISGYMLLSCNPPFGYRGVDRERFEPSLAGIPDDEEEAVDLSVAPGKIWPFIRKEWLRNAYKFYEEHQVTGSVAEEQLIDLLADIHSAKQLQHMIQPYVGPYEIVYCQVFSIHTRNFPSRNENSGEFLGYDVAYFGGDFYSAVYRGLLYDPCDRLVSKYLDLLNSQRLFSCASTARKYLDDFLAVAEWESADYFALHHLELCR